MPRTAHKLSQIDTVSRTAYCQACETHVDILLVRRFGQWQWSCPEALFRQRAGKYKAQPYTTRDGKSFPSGLEGKRWEQLSLLEHTGKIKNLRRQVPFRLHAPLPGGAKEFIGKYVADFVYETPSGKAIVEETKGFWTDLARWKWKHVRAEYGSEYEFREVRKAK